MSDIVVNSTVHFKVVAEWFNVNCTGSHVATVLVVDSVNTGNTFKSVDI